MEENWVSTSLEELTHAVSTVKRKATAMIGGFAIAMALCVPAPAQAESSEIMEIENPIVEFVEQVPMSDFSKQIGNDPISRKVQMEYSIGINGGMDMDADAKTLWHEILSQAVDIPFSDIFLQYDDVSKSFYLSFSFKHNRRVEATTYVDNEDPTVYFSVFSNNEKFYQGFLPRKEFFRESARLWATVNERSC